MLYFDLLIQLKKHSTGVKINDEKQDQLFISFYNTANFKLVIKSYVRLIHDNFKLSTSFQIVNPNKFGFKPGSNFSNLYLENFSFQILSSLKSN